MGFCSPSLRTSQRHTWSELIERLTSILAFSHHSIIERFVNCSESAWMPLPANSQKRFVSISTHHSIIERFVNCSESARMPLPADSQKRFVSISNSVLYCIIVHGSVMQIMIEWWLKETYGCETLDELRPGMPLGATRLELHNPIDYR